MRDICRVRHLVFVYFVISTGGVLWLIMNYDLLCSEDLKSGNNKHPRIILDNSRHRYPEAVGSFNISLPTIFAVTPTHARPVQKAELTRIAQTFMQVPNFHWIVVEDANNTSHLVANFLKNSGMKFTHLVCQTPVPYKLGENDPNWLKPRGVEQRNTAIDWLVANIDVDGVVYFADDDNTYALQLFEEMRNTRKVAMWPVGLVGGQMLESPLVDEEGRIYGWNVGWKPQRPFPMDMASFAINLRLLKEKQARFSLTAKRGYLESSLLTRLVRIDELEPKAEMCTKVYVWHTRTEKPKLKYKIEMDEMQIEV